MATIVQLNRNYFGNALPDIKPAVTETVKPEIVEDVPMLDKSSLRGDWEATRRALSFSSCYDDYNRMGKANYERACFHAYFGNEVQRDGTYKLTKGRGGSRNPTVLTPDFLVKLGTANLEQRRINHPSAVRIAELLEELRKLEQEF